MPFTWEAAAARLVGIVSESPDLRAKSSPRAARSGV
jgi:hypothetical protein